MNRNRTKVPCAHTDARFCIVGPLGAGGMGTVVEAIDTTRGGRVALKFARGGPTGQRGSIRQLVAEGAAMTLARGRHVCRAFEVATHGNQPCLAMERLIGGTLDSQMARGPLPLDVVVDVALQLADALATVHRAGLVHHDIKPANVFMTSARLVKLLDFGLAVPAGTSSAVPAARRISPPLLGTANYLAPERILRGSADPRSDLFSLGVMLYEMVTGRQPFAGASPSQVIFNVLDADPGPVRAAAPDCPLALERVIRTLLQKRATRRFQSAVEVGRALHAVHLPRGDRRLALGVRLVEGQIARPRKGGPVAA